MNCVIRPSSPKLVTVESSQLASACAVTWLCAKIVDRSGSSPVAMSIATQIERRFAEVGGLVLDADRVQVDDAEERLSLFLRRRVLAEAAA